MTNINILHILLIIKLILISIKKIEEKKNFFIK
jgi:hypothetical protein